MFALDAGVRGSGGSAEGGGPRFAGRSAGAAPRPSQSPKVRRTPRVKALLPPLPHPENQPPVFRAGQDCASVAQPLNSRSTKTIVIARPHSIAFTDYPFVCRATSRIERPRERETCSLRPARDLGAIRRFSLLRPVVSDRSASRERHRPPSGRRCRRPSRGLGTIEALFLASDKFPISGAA
jgi:hypothetical protein